MKSSPSILQMSPGTERQEWSVLMLMTLAPIPAIRQSVGVGRREGSSYTEGGRDIAVINQDFLFGVASVVDGEKLERRRARNGKRGKD